ncbi:MAG: GlsB/YeaQ/YmgE family stress response membrane protein, partial [Trebonia sp.]
MVGAILMLLIVGLFVGAIARLLMPGRDPIGCLGTIGLGIAGSFIGGFLQNLVLYHSLRECCVSNDLLFAHVTL